MLKKILYILFATIIDGIISFIVLFLFVMGFATMPRISGYDPNQNLAKIRLDAEHYLSGSRMLFFTEMFVGLLLIFLTTYFLLRTIIKRPFLWTSGVCLIYLVAFITLYCCLCRDFIAGNMSF
ncbi:MAG: hypothetical protein ACXVEB_15055 [Bacteroidia bacterium]